MNPPMVQEKQETEGEKDRKDQEKKEVMEEDETEEKMEEGEASEKKKPEPEFGTPQYYEERYECITTWSLSVGDGRKRKT